MSTTTSTEYAVRNDSKRGYLSSTYTKRATAEELADMRRECYGIDCTVVRRTVTYGEWEPVQ